MRPRFLLQTTRHILALATALSLIVAIHVRSLAQCPIEFPDEYRAKSHTLYLYFPVADDPTFPDLHRGFRPARAFDVAALSLGIGTTSQLIETIHRVVDNDYCEFNVQVISTRINPATMPILPPRRATIAIGSDNSGDGAWGRAWMVDTGDAHDLDFARVWAGLYTTCEGATRAGCSMTGALTGAHATLERWAQAIGGTIAHEAGHTYGLSHSEDNPPDDPREPGPLPLPGEDSFHRHLMPSGYNLSGEDRAGYRRHFSDRTYSLLAANVGLSMQTIHNWDLVNPNAEDARSLVIDFLSEAPAVNVTWSYDGSNSPWINAEVSGPTGTTFFRGKRYNRNRLTWSTPNPASTIAAPGVLPGGAEFHIGTTFSGVDFTIPDSVIIQNVTLLDGFSRPLTLHPRLPMYDAGTVDAADGSFAVNFQDAPGGAPLILQDATIYHLPRVAAIESMVGAGRPLTRSGDQIRPWAVIKCPPAKLANGARCVIAKTSDKHYVEVIRKLGEKGVYDCSKVVPKIDRPTSTKSEDSPHIPDFEGPICAGVQRDLFPSTTVYVIATFVDPAARHYDPRQRGYVVGPVTSKVFFQFAGARDVKKLRRSR